MSDLRASIISEIEDGGYATGADAAFLADRILELLWVRQAALSEQDEMRSFRERVLAAYSEPGGIIKAAKLVRSERVCSVKDARLLIEGWVQQARYAASLQIPPAVAPQPAASAADAPVAPERVGNDG